MRFLFLAVQLVTLSAWASPTSLRGLLILEDQHYKIETLKGATLIDTSGFNEKSLAFLRTMLRQIVFAWGDDEDGVLRVDSASTMGLRFEMNTGVQVTVSAERIVLTTPSSIYEIPGGTRRDNEYPFVWFQAAEFGLRPIALEGPLVDHMWLKSYVKAPQDLAPLFHLTGEFVAPTDFRVDSIEGSGATLLASGRLSEANGEYRLVYEGERRVMDRPLISADPSVNLKNFKGQPVIVEADIESLGEQEILVITPKSRIQNSDQYTCAVEVFNKLGR